MWENLRWPIGRRLRKRSNPKGEFIRQSGGRGQYGHVWLTLEPQAPGKGFEFVNRIVGGAIPREYIPAVQKGVQEAMEKGVLAGYPMVDMKVTLIDGSYHEVDSSEMAFKIAGSMGFKEGARRANPILLEPLMSIEIITPEEFMGQVISDLNSQERQDNTSGIPEGDQCDCWRGSPCQYVWICDRPSVSHPRKGDVYPAIFPLQSGARSVSEEILSELRRVA